MSEREDACVYVVMGVSADSGFGDNVCDDSDVLFNPSFRVKLLMAYKTRLEADSCALAMNEQAKGRRSDYAYAAIKVPMASTRPTTERHED